MSESGTRSLFAAPRWFRTALLMAGGALAVALLTLSHMGGPQLFSNTALTLFSLAASTCAWRLNVRLARKELENQELRLARVRDEAAAIAKDQFLAHMSHEIRTPMTSILGFADVLLEPDQSQAERDEALHSIRRNASHLTELINNILDLSKIQAGQMSVERLTCNLPELIQLAICLTRQALLDKGLAFRVMNDGPLPTEIQTDPLRVRQILVNLISNAGKFTERGQIELRVRCRPAEDAGGNSAIQFIVKDTGIGMTPLQVTRLFQPFAQADESTARRFGGSGLGLAISKSLAGLLGGDIRVQSEPGVGSRFTLEIDAGRIDGVAMIDAIPDQPAASPVAAVAQRPRKLRGRVLLAEDGPDNQRLIALRLRQAGVSVAIAADGRAALERLAAESFDLVLMDLQMPVVDGASAVARLRRGGYELPIVALTARATSADRERCLAAGFDDYLTKPIDKLKLWNCLRQYLDASPDSGEPPIVSGLSDDPELKDLLAEFVSLLPQKVRELERLTLARDAAALRQFTHRLNGAAGGYGFPEITKAAANLELMLQDGVDWESAASAAASLVQLIRRVEGYHEPDRAKERPAA